jgi:ribosomal protein S18 acetylase RimI-like enzyme
VTTNAIDTVGELMFDCAILTLPVERWREYRTLRLNALADTPGAFGASYAASVANPDDYWLGRLQDALDGRSLLLFAESGGQLVGMLGAFWGNASQAEGVANVIAVFVEPAWRGQGIAGQLLDALLERLRATPGLHTAELDVAVEQSAAVALYQRAGFEISATHPGVMGDGIERDEYLMRRAL